MEKQTKQYVLSADVLQMVLDYLSKRPLGESYNVFEAIKSDAKLVVDKKEEASTTETAASA